MRSLSEFKHAMCSVVVKYSRTHHRFVSMRWRTVRGSTSVQWQDAVKNSWITQSLSGISWFTLERSLSSVRCVRKDSLLISTSAHTFVLTLVKNRMFALFPTVTNASLSQVIWQRTKRPISTKNLSYVKCVTRFYTRPSVGQFAALNFKRSNLLFNQRLQLNPH